MTIQARHADDPIQKCNMVKISNKILNKLKKEGYFSTH